MEENKNVLEEQLASDQQPEEQKASIEESVAEPTEESVAEPTAESVAEPSAEPVAEPSAEPVPQPKKKKKVGLILGIIFGSIAVLIIAIVLFFTLKDNKNLTRNSFIKEIGGVSETFIGAVSEREYFASTDAAEDYVHVEVVGDAYATVLSIDSKGPAQSSEHKIPAEFLEGSEMVEKFEVEFSVPTEASLKREVQLLSSSTEGEKKAKVVVYVIKYENNWKYFAPLPVTGDTISKSYYDSVFNNEKYQNCTLEIVQTTKSSTFGITVAEYSLYQLFKFQDGKVYIEQKETSKELGKTTVNTLYFYAEEHDNGYIECYIKENNGIWQDAELRQIGFYSLKELTPFYDNMYLDYTYFEKTDYGFDLPKENAKAYFTDSMYDALRQEDLDINKEDIDVDMYAEYFVREGTLTGMRTNADINLKITEDGIGIGVKANLSEIVKVTDYGTTVVEKPNVN